jgi:hypothetical protein
MQFHPTWLELPALPGSDGSLHTKLKEGAADRYR